MGQQQLLLVILVTIIVGIATVVAINTFSSAADSANLDAVRQDVATIAASAQGYFMKPDMLGGGSQEFTGITFNDISFAADTINAGGDRAMNENGVYELVSANATTLVIDAFPASIVDGALSVESTPTLITGETKLTANITQDDMDWQ